jgi:hypothetical protein
MDARGTPERVLSTDAPNEASDTADTEGRPARWRDFQRQNTRKLVRCQRRRVSGLKMIDASSREGNRQ